MKRPRASAHAQHAGVGPSYNRQSLLPSGDLWMMSPRPEETGPQSRDLTQARGCLAAPGHERAQAPGMGRGSATGLLILVMMRQVITVIDPATFDAAEFLI